MELTYHPRRLRLLSEEAGRPTSDVHSEAQGALSCAKTIQGTRLTHTKCMNLAWSLGLLVSDRDGPGRYMVSCHFGGFNGLICGF